MVTLEAIAIYAVVIAAIAFFVRRAESIEYPGERKDKTAQRDPVLDDLIGGVMFAGIAAYVILRLLLILAAIAFGIAMFVKLVMFFI